MSADVEVLLRELDVVLGELKETLHNTTNFNPEDRQLKLTRAQRSIQSIKTLKEACLLEARSLASAQERSDVEDALRRRMQVFRDLCNDFQNKKNEIDRDQLQAEAEAESLDGMEGTSQTQALIQKGDQLQDQTQDAISRMKGLAVDAEDVGIAAAQKMDAQMEQMGRVAEHLDDVQYNTKRARDTAVQMAKGAAKDLCIQILCGGIVLCLITIIVLISV
eukprot:Gregarina_sp_Pseudo_9__4930@NODE_516_length_2662_cov_8_912695_g487_i0_p2_GENE_NODE_516_length_2662_cov_8_912695_g487_i0NODE_516_length_2662_cov_8_912695_g487_i0_p2_ORF_typecomplete_len220_score54_98VSNARE_C/PF12352_8/1_9e03VSNARE_C/PF12352_8/2_1e05Sec20/PF03908_13/3_3e02Sec20/PF03908_13/2_4e02Sec20/PF03908_13/8_8e05RTC/PF01137_21/0_007Bac_GDH/PF05088_12/0_075FUSC/PF04632_12/0_08DUF1307/PF06998_11/1_3e03DUF1307/PF06998_11/0_35VSNARE/PF05008_15/0_11VSNARE/PF05008_15/74Synaptobrevin/PF00957_21/4_1e